MSSLGVPPSSTSNESILPSTVEPENTESTRKIDSNIVGTNIATTTNEVSVTTESKSNGLKEHLAETLSIAVSSETTKQNKSDNTVTNSEIKSNESHEIPNNHISEVTVITEGN